MAPTKIEVSSSLWPMFSCPLPSNNIGGGENVKIPFPSNVPSGKENGETCFSFSSQKPVGGQRRLFVNAIERRSITSRHHGSTISG